MKADRRLEAEAKATLSEFAAAYESHQADKLMALFAPRTKLEIAGPGKVESRYGAAELKAHFEAQWAKAKAAPVLFEGAKVTAEGSAIAVAADTTLYLEAGAEKAGYRAKLSADLEKHGERWLINKLHLSLPEGDAGEAAAAKAAGAAGAQAKKAAAKAAGAAGAHAKAASAKAAGAAGSAGHAKA